MQRSLTALTGSSMGAGNGLGLSLPGPDQLRNLSWANLDKIYIQFSEDVSAAFTAANLALVGTNVPDYEPFANLQYGVDGTNVGTITLSAPLAADALILSVFDSLTDTAGNSLDGEWTNSVSTVSGDGNAGGRFDFRIDVLPGDIDDNGFTNLDDLLAILAVQGAQVGGLSYSAGMDVNGDTFINLKRSARGA